MSTTAQFARENGSVFEHRSTAAVYMFAPEMTSPYPPSSPKTLTGTKKSSKRPVHQKTSTLPPNLTYYRTNTVQKLQLLTN